MTRPVIDISRPLHSNLPPWPGDRGVTFEQVLRIRDGASVNIGHLGMSVHNGTHADAPYHYNDQGTCIDAVPLERYVGPAHVVDAMGVSQLVPELFVGLDFKAAPRLLVRTGAWTDANSFPSGWPALAPELPNWLASRGVQLIGLDAPSVDPRESKLLPIHHALDAAGILILENLDLDRAAPGIYELIALPLRIQGGDGSPVRAVLRPLCN
jgi:arylformamidase